MASVEPTADQVQRAWQALAARCGWSCTREEALANAVQLRLLQGEARRLAERECGRPCEPPRPPAPAAKPRAAGSTHWPPLHAPPARGFDWKRAASGERDDD